MPHSKKRKMQYALRPLLILMLVTSIVVAYYSASIRNDKHRPIDFFGEFRLNAVEESGLVAVQKIPISFNGETSLMAVWSALVPHCTELEIRELKRNDIKRGDVIVFRGWRNGHQFEIQKTIELPELESIISDLPDLDLATSFKMVAENYPTELGRISTKLPNVTDLTCHCRALFYEKSFDHLIKIRRIDCTEYDTYLFPDDLDGHCRKRFPKLVHFKIWYWSHNGG